MFAPIVINDVKFKTPAVAGCFYFYGEVNVLQKTIEKFLTMQ